MIEWLGEHRAQKTGEEAKKGEHCQASQERRGGGLRSKHISGPSAPPLPLCSSNAPCPGEEEGRRQKKKRRRGQRTLLRLPSFFNKILFLFYGGALAPPEDVVCDVRNEEAWPEKEEEETEKRANRKTAAPPKSSLKPGGHTPRSSRRRRAKMYYDSSSLSFPPYFRKKYKKTDGSPRPTNSSVFPTLLSLLASTDRGRRRTEKSTANWIKRKKGRRGEGNISSLSPSHLGGTSGA